MKSMTGLSKRTMIHYYSFVMVVDMNLYLPKTGWKRIDRVDILYQTQLPIISYFHDNVTTGRISKVEI